jgi:ribosomal protein S18 acetylase RimI-like enzyme
VRTGPDLRETHTLNDGTRVVLRHIRPEDSAELARDFARLSPESRHRRFFGGVTQLSDAALRYLTEVDGHDHVAIVATCDSPDLKTEAGLGVARFVRLHDEPTVAEAAVTVVDDVQRRGLGRLLAATLAVAAHERGIRSFRADVLADNEPMVRLLHEVGARALSTDSGVISFDIPLEPWKDERGGVVDRLFHAAAGATGAVAVLLRRLALPPGHA